MATNFYRAKDPETGKEVFKEVGTDRYIGPTEFGRGSGYTEQTATPTTPTAPVRTGETTSGLGTYKGNNKLIDIIKEGIKRKQGYNKDIQGAKTTFRSQLNNPMTFSDERLRLLSPSEQQQIREARYATANASLKGLGEEEAYREGRLSDTIDSVTRASEAEMADKDLALRQAQEARLGRSANINDYLDLKGTGYTTDQEGNIARDYTSATAEQIAMAMKGVESGGNYDAKGGSNESGAYQYTPGTWARYSKEYAEEVLGRSELLPMTKENQDAVTVHKIQKWLDGGYTPQQIVSMWNAGEGRPNAYAENHRGTNSFGVKYDTPGHVDKVMRSLGRVMGEPAAEEEPIKLTDAQKQAILKSSGFTEKDAKDLGITTHDDWTALVEIGRDGAILEVQDELSAAKIKKEDPNKLVNRLKTEYSWALSDDALKYALSDYMTYDSGDYYWKVE